MIFVLLLLVDIQSTDKVDKDNDPSSDTDGETQTHHSTSKEGIYIILLHNVVINILILYIVQVPNDSGIPDNIYTGRIYYERIGSNKWVMMFMVVQKINVFLEVINMVSSVT